MLLSSSLLSLLFVSHDSSIDGDPEQSHNPHVDKKKGLQTARRGSSTE